MATDQLGSCRPAKARALIFPFSCMFSPWLCAQLGAREHYAVPRALNQSDKLEALFTDAWVNPGSAWGALNHNLRTRFHPDLAAASVTSWNASLLAFELTARTKKQSGWPLIMKRNRWFQQRVVNALSSLPIKTSSSPVLFAYSYAALEMLRFARKKGWRTVLGQIDPGPVEERLVGKLHQQNAGTTSQWAPAPEEYWRLWREECALADHIVVNSEWSRAALIEEGMTGEKITVIPLAFDQPAEAAGFKRSYPTAFTKERPLRVLFLGQVNLRKGMAEVMEAMRRLQDSPIEFWIVGPAQMEIPRDLRNHPRARWTGAVPRDDAANYYRQADVFLFPTHSDGFGLTQLEAQAWKLPIIASRFCGEVVEDGRNGWLLPEVSVEAISTRLAECARRSELLVAAAAESAVAPQFTLESVGASFSRIMNADVAREKN